MEMHSKQSERARKKSQQPRQSSRSDGTNPAVKRTAAHLRITPSDSLDPDSPEPINHGRLSWEKRHQQLLNASLGVFAQKGFDGATTRELVRAAGISASLLFYHFPTKEELYAATLHYKMEQGQAEFREALECVARRRSDHTVFKTVAMQVLNFYLRDPDYLRLLVYSGLESHELAKGFIQQHCLPLRQFLIAYLQQRMEEGAFRWMKPEPAARAFLGMVCNHALVQVLFEDPIFQITPEQAADAFVDIFLHGILNGS